MLALIEFTLQIKVTELCQNFLKIRGTMWRLCHNVPIIIFLHEREQFKVCTKPFSNKHMQWFVCANIYWNRVIRLSTRNESKRKHLHNLWRIGRRSNANSRLGVHQKRMVIPFWDSNEILTWQLWLWWDTLQTLQLDETRQPHRLHPAQFWRHNSILCSHPIAPEY